MWSSVVHRRPDSSPTSTAGQPRRLHHDRRGEGCRRTRHPAPDRPKSVQVLRDTIRHDSLFKRSAARPRSACDGASAVPIGRAQVLRLVKAAGQRAGVAGLWACAPSSDLKGASMRRLTASRFLTSIIPSNAVFDHTVNRAGKQCLLCTVHSRFEALSCSPRYILLSYRPCQLSCADTRVEANHQCHH